MKKLTNWIVSKTIKGHENTKDLRVRSDYGRLEGWVSIIINLILFLFKLVAGIMIKSVSLTTDAMHTLFDSITSIVVIVGFKAAGRPSDREHPFGHGRVEPVATLIIAVLLFITGFEMLKSSIEAIINPKVATAGVGILVFVFIAMIIKELLARFSRQLGNMIGSKTLMADYLHHRSDVLATFLVLVGLVMSNYGLKRIDGIMGVFVSLIIAYSGYRIGKEAISPLLGEAPSPEKIKKIRDIALKVKGVQGVHDIIYHEYGQIELCSLHVEVSEDASSVELHGIAETVEKNAAVEINGRVVVHVDPVNRNYPLYEEIKNSIDKIISGSSEIISFHELRIVSRKDRIKLIFDIVLKEDLKEKDISRIKKYVSAKLREKHKDMDVVINIDPKYVYNP